MSCSFNLNVVANKKTYFILLSKSIRSKSFQKPAKLHVLHASSDTRHRERFIRVANERPSPRDLIKKTIINQPDNRPRPTSANTTTTGSQSGRRQWGSRSSKTVHLGLSYQGERQYDEQQHARTHRAGSA